MKKLLYVFLLFPLIILGSDKKTPSTIKEVTVYLSGAQITRSANLVLKAGVTEIVFNDLSHKIDESSIQLSGLQSVNILSITYDINYLRQSEASPKVYAWEQQLEVIKLKINSLENTIAGLQEEVNIITSNRSVGVDENGLDLEKIKRISQYYRERTTAIKNEIFQAKRKIVNYNTNARAIEKQQREVNTLPETEEGEIKVKFDTAIPITLELRISYKVKDAGWIPNYNIKSKELNAPIELTYKAHVYQRTGQNWDRVKVILSTRNPNKNVQKPILETHYLNFTNTNYNRHKNTLRRKQKYHYNPTVKRVSGKVTDQSGLVLPGVTILISGTTIGTQTDFDGNFSIDIAQGRELVYSYLGQKTVQLPIYASLMNVRMEEETEFLEEVIVTGYSTSAVQGKVRGVRSTPKVIPPLYVIDGIPIAGFTEGDLDENEIQSIEVLQGDSATSIYGSRGSNGIVVITTKKSITEDDVIQTKFIIKKPYSIQSDGDITAIEVNTFKLKASYSYFAAPIIDENVFLTASFSDWEQYNLLPGEANIYFSGTYAGKTTIDPYALTKKMTISLGIDDNIAITRKQDRDFKSRSFIGNQRILNRNYTLQIKNNKPIPIVIKLMDRIPLSQNKEIKVSDIEVFNADYDKKKGILTWNLTLKSQQTQEEQFAFQVKYPRYKKITL